MNQMNQSLDNQIAVDRAIALSNLRNANGEILFRDLIKLYEPELKTHMTWENYDLNSTTIPVVDLIKDHALMVLSKSYGMFHVEQTIVDELCADVFINFPILLQQVGISRLMDAYGVVADDINTEQFSRIEVLSSDSSQNSELQMGTMNTDTNLLDTQQKTTGNLKTGTDSSNTQNSTTDIENTSNVEMTGNRTVNMSHSMPEQALSTTGQFEKDLEGTPVLNLAYVQNASESFNTSNPIGTLELSQQTIANRENGTVDTTTTNDVIVADTGNNVRTVVNSGKDNSITNTVTDSTNTITESRTRNETNKQYAYEIKAFLESTDTLNAFRNWEDSFDWVVGII